MIIIGFGEMYPTPDTPLSGELFFAGMLCLCGLPALSWLINIVCMRFYPLDSNKMKEIQEQIAAVRQES
jgi:Na+/melibiose symporter-like transporter